MTPASVPLSTPASIPDAEAAWRQLVARDPAALFFYGVTTTGVFCRAGCASRRPRRENVRFFPTAAEAQAAGFRACARCKPGAARGTTGAARGNPLDKVRAHIERNLDGPVRLKELGQVAGMSPFTVQRLFKREMGVSPLAYQRGLRAGALRASLKRGDRVTDAIYNAGFGSPSRAYEANQLGMTPERFARGGQGERIGWASGPSPFGWVIAGATERGLCWLSLAGTRGEAEAGLRAEFPAATLRRDPALRQIPRGQTRSYSQLARELGDAKATRAVARACGANRVAVFVPCHRVVGTDGALTGYRWGVERKQRLLEAELQANGGDRRAAAGQGGRTRKAGKRGGLQRWVDQ